jgi:solute carrier family 13 (sodium-dependent dicarboxylate transporter), member 2/3/5
MQKRYYKKALITGGFTAFGLTLLLTGADNLFINALALGSLMVFFWISEVIPIYLTALFPFIFAVPLGLIDAQGLSKAYGNTMVYLFLGGFILALALEKWDIHTQIAKRILKVVGNSKPRVLLGFLLSTSLLSMWISNTATALMMLPMALAVIKSLNSAEKQSKFSYLLMLSIAYGSNVGGMATLVGSPPNLQMASILNSQYGTEIGFVEWFQIGLPLTSILTAIIYLVFWLILGKERSENSKISTWRKRNGRKINFLFTRFYIGCCIMDFSTIDC